MCGITGFFNPYSLDDEFRDRELLKKMIRSLFRRGPDECGALYSKIAFLGHTRLSILDLESGQQLEGMIPEQKDMVVEKDVNSGFIGTSLELDLRRACIYRLVIVGFFTNVCIETTVRMSGNMGFDTYLVHDACAAMNCIGHDGTDYDPEIVHNMAIANLHGEFCTAITTEDALKLCEKDCEFLNRVQGNE